MSAPDDEWIESLAGRASPPSADGREAAALRRQILARTAEPAVAVSPTDAAREAALLERARREQLLPAAPAPLASASVRRWRTRGVFAAAAVVVLAIVATMSWQGQPAREVVRGLDNGVVRIEAADPAALKQQLIAELVAAGVKVSGYERLGSVGLDADLPQPLPDAVGRVLGRHHIPVPADGVLVIEIRAAARP